MKTFLKYILIMLIVSCDSFDDIVGELEEEEAQLQNNYYIIEGWNAIQSYDYLSAVEFFNYSVSINQDDLDLLLQSLHGLSWSQMLYGSSLFGESLSQERLGSRKASYNSFFRIDSVLSANPESLMSDLYNCDINAGKILYTDHQIYHYNSQYFGSGAGLVDEYLDSLSWFSDGELIDATCNDCNDNGHIELGLQYLVESMESECPLYDFQYANINTYDIQVMLLKDYIRKDQLADAVNILNRINREPITLSVSLGFEQDQSNSGNISIIGDFINKTISDDDLYSMNQVSDSLYSIEFDIYPFLPCNTLAANQQLLEDDDLRNEFVECIDSYFESNEDKIFKYKFINGDYNSNVSNHESVPNQCSDDEGYRVLSIPNSSNEIIVNDCYNSCYDCND